MTLGLSSIQSGAFARRPIAWPIFDQSDSTSRPVAELRRVDPGLGREQALRELEVAHLEREEEHRPLRFERGVRGHAEGEGGVVHEHVGGDEVVGDRDRQVVDLMHPDELDLEDLVPQRSRLQGPRVGSTVEHLALGAATVTC